MNDLSRFVPELSDSDKDYVVKRLASWMAEHAPNQALPPFESNDAAIVELTDWLVQKAPGEAELIRVVEAETQDDLDLSDAEISESNALIYVIEEAFTRARTQQVANEN